MEKSEKLSNRARLRRIKRRNNSSYSNVVTKQQVKQMIESKMDKVQDKFLNTVIYNVVTPNPSGTLVQPTLPAQGVTNGQREGDSLCVDVIEANLFFINGADSVGVAGASDLIRLICVQARANTVLTVSNSVAPTTGVLDLGSDGSVDVNSFVNLNASNELFHVLYDKTHAVNFLSATATTSLRLHLKPAVSKINFTPGTTTSMCGGIFWIVLSVQGATADISMVQRLVYHDL
jgi:hypothetical protein